jgi:hypothetical protein
MFKKRADMLSHFRHEVSRAWDIESGDGSRTLMYESASATVLKADAQETQVKVAEFNIIQLEPCEPGKGFEGLWGTELKCWMDPAKVVKRMQEVKETAGEESV